MLSFEFLLHPSPHALHVLGVDSIVVRVYEVALMNNNPVLVDTAIQLSQVVIGCPTISNYVGSRST
jgi:hypothetical protein